MNRANRPVRVASVVFALLCVVVSAIGLKLTDSPLEFHKVTGVVGQTLEIDGVQLTVLGVTVGQTLADSRGKPLVRSPGLFVGVDVLVACPGAKGNPASRTRLRADDRRYEEWGSGGALTPAAGYRTTNRVIFEIDPDDLGSLVLDAGPIEIISGYQAHGWIDLGLAGTADQIRAEAAGRVVGEVSTVEEPIR